MTDSTDYVLYGIMIIASLGLIFFIVNFIRCRNQRIEDEYEVEEELGHMKQKKFKN